MNKRYLGLYFLMLCILFLFPPCVGKGNGYYVGHVFILNVGTFVDVPTPNGIGKSIAFLAEIAWQKVAIEILAISAFTGMLFALNVFERLGQFKDTNRQGHQISTKLKLAIRLLILPTILTIAGLCLISLALSEVIGAWGNFGWLLFFSGALTLLSNYKKFL